MPVVATGQFTIIDYNDALTLTGFISSNHPKTQIYNPDNASWAPNWNTNNLILTPSLYKLGTSTDIIGSSEVQSVTWHEVTNGTESAALTTGGVYEVKTKADSYKLIIKDNILGSTSAKDFVCKVVYKDPTTNLELTHKMSITFSKVINGGGITDAVAWTPDGNVFKNEQIPTLRAQCDLWRGSVVDTTLVEYYWFIRNSSVFSKNKVTVAGSNLTQLTLDDVNGITNGSKIKINSGATVYTVSAVDTANKKITISPAATVAVNDEVKHEKYLDCAGAGWEYIQSDIANSITGVTTNVVTVYDAFVPNQLTLLCCIKDVDTSSNTYNQYFKDSITLIDQSDPVQVSIFSSGGDVFKNGVGTTTLTAKVFRGGSEIDTGGTTYTYKWYRYDKNGNVDSNFGGAGVSYKTGKSITVGDADVDVKATFVVEISQ